MNEACRRSIFVRMVVASIEEMHLHGQYESTSPDADRSVSAFDEWCYEQESWTMLKSDFWVDIRRLLCLAVQKEIGESSESDAE